MEKKQFLGQILVFTGSGKGKTTAALGHIVRSLGHNYQIALIQFMKGSELYGEVKILQNLPNILVEQYGLASFVHSKNPSKLDRDLAQRGLARVHDLFRQNKHDLIVLDEINVAYSFSLITLQEFKEVVLNKPQNCNLILTGRDFPSSLVDLVDLISEVKEIKHPYQLGREAQAGVEF